MRVLTLSLGATAALAAFLPAQSSITTTFSGGLSFGLSSAHLFDMQLNTGVTINQLDVNVGEAAGTIGSISVYTTPGSYVGNELNTAVWTMVGSASITAAGLRTPSLGTLNTAVALTPGNHGIAICYNGLTPQYLRASAPTTYSNADMTLTLGAAVNGCFTGSVLNHCVWNGTIHYQPGSNLATWGSYGTGCGAGDPPGFYELFDATANPVDLANRDFTMNAAGLSYVVTPGTGTWFTPTSAPLATGDDDTQRITLPWPFPFQGGLTNDIWVCSNGWIALQFTSSTSYTESVSELLSGPARVCALWDDLNPGSGGSLHFDVDPSGGAVYVTWLGVPEFGVTSGFNDFQVKFDQFANIELRYRSLAVADALVGFSPGNNATDPGPVDISAIMGLALGDARPPLTLGNQAGSRPVIGTTFTMEVNSIPPGTMLGAIVYSFTKINPGTSLSGLGMPGCFQFVNLDATFLILPMGTTHSIPFIIPNLISLAGSHVYAQAATFSSGFNPLGVISSNGGDMLFDIN